MQIFVKAVRDAVVNLTITETRRFGRPTKLLFERFDKFENMLHEVFFGKDELASPLGLKWRRCGRRDGLRSPPHRPQTRARLAPSAQEISCCRHHVSPRAGLKPARGKELFSSEKPTDRQQGATESVNHPLVNRLTQAANNEVLFHTFTLKEFEELDLPPISPDSCVRASGFWFKPVQGMSIYIKGYDFGRRLRFVTRNRMAKDALSVISTYEVHMGGVHFSPHIILKGLRMSGKDLRSDENEIKCTQRECISSCPRLALHCPTLAR